MKQHKLAKALGLGLAMALASGSALAEGPDLDRVWVKFKPGTRGNVEQALRASGGRIHHTFESMNAFAVSVPQQALDGLLHNPNIELIEPDAPRYSMAQTVPYGIDMVQARDIWDANRDDTVDAGAPTGAGIKVCVIDSGIHQGHQDFSGISMSGYPAGWNNDTCGHGTHVAGTIAAAHNSAGVVGVSPGGVSLFVVQVFNGASCGWSYSSDLVDAANRCRDAGAKVISMSLGGSVSSATESTAFTNLNNQGILSIAAAGNAGNTTNSYPASYPAVMSVAAVDSAKALASFSQRNAEVEIAAPGVAVLSTVPFVTASATVGSAGYLVEALTGSIEASGSGTTVNGGRCTGTNAAWADRVVLCERGDIAFADKATNAQNSGAAAVIIYNNVPGGFSGTLNGAISTIPSVSMSQADGQYIVANQLGANATVSTVSGTGNGYANYDGTSMATPHVSGVAALVWSHNPSWTNVQVRNALNATAEDLGTAGRDTSFGYGLVRAKAALDHLIAGGGGGGTPVTASVGSMSLSTVRKGKNYTATAVPTIVNASGQPLASVSVTGCFSGAVSGCSTLTSNGSGQASFKSASYRTAGAVTFCVTNVTGTNVTFNSANACRTTN